MSEFDAVPTVLFKTRTNTELGAGSVSVADDGSIVLHDVMKKVTESMLTSYPRTLLGKWTPNRAAVRYSRDEIPDRAIREYPSGKPLDAEGVAALAG